MPISNKFTKFHLKLHKSHSSLVVSKDFSLKFFNETLKEWKTWQLTTSFMYFDMAICGDMSPLNALSFVLNQFFSIFLNQINLIKLISWNEVFRNIKWINASVVRMSLISLTAQMTNKQVFPFWFVNFHLIPKCNKNVNAVIWTILMEQIFLKRIQLNLKLWIYSVFRKIINQFDITINTIVLIWLSCICLCSVSQSSERNSFNWLIHW